MILTTRIEPRIHNRNGQTVFAQYSKDGELLASALIYAEIVIDGSKLCKPIEVPVRGQLSDYLKLGWIPAP